MTHFDFIVTEEEAETIFSSIEAEMDRCRMEGRTSDSMRRKWNLDRLEYLVRLRSKMTNSKIS